MRNPKDAVSPSQIRERMRKRQGHWPKISAKAAVSYSSITKFMRSESVTPRVETLQRLSGALDQLDREAAKAAA